MRKYRLNERNGSAPTICSGYFKYGVETLLGWNFGTTGFAIVEFYEK